MKPVITELRKTCPACPSQWEGETEDGQHVYIRYRWGRLTAGVGDTAEAAVSDEFLWADVGHPACGSMSDKRMAEFLEGFLEFQCDVSSEEEW